METNLLGVILQLVVSCFIGILTGKVFLWGFPYVIKKNEMKVVKKGYKRLLSWYWYLGNRLSDAAEVELVKLAGISEVHKDILLKYNHALCYDASILLVENEDLSEILEKLLDYPRGGIQSALIKKAETSERCKELLLNYIKNGYYLSEKNVLSLDDSMFGEYCKNHNFLDSEVELHLIKKAGVDQKFKTILVEYIRKGENCSPNSIDEKSERQLIQEKLFDVIEEYRNVVKKFGDGAQAQLLESFKSDSRFRKALIKEVPVLSKKSFDDLVAYTLQNDQLIDILELCVSIRKFENNLEISLVEAYQKNKKYTLALREYIKKYELCSLAQNLLMVPLGGNHFLII